MRKQQKKNPLFINNDVIFHLTHRRWIDAFAIYVYKYEKMPYLEMHSIEKVKRANDAQCDSHIEIKRVHSNFLQRHFNENKTNRKRETKKGISFIVYHHRWVGEEDENRCTHLLKSI